MSKKIKKIFSLSCLILAFSATQALAEDDDYDVAGRVALIKSSSRAFAEVEGDDDPCMAISPLCIIRTILKATPTLPVHDIIATPAMIRHVPAALAKEGQLQLKLTAEEKLRKLRSKDTPSKTKVPFISPGYDGAIPAANEEYMTLEAFPVTDSEDPIEIAKAIEPIFVRLGWNDPDTPVTQYDQKLMHYYQGRFAMNNAIEILGFAAYMQNKVDEMLVSADKIREQIETAEDLNASQRANYAAQLLEYELMIIQNQIKAVSMQADIADAIDGTVMDAPVFGSM